MIENMEDLEVIGEQMLEQEDRDLIDRVYSTVEIFEQANREYHDYAKEARNIVRMQDPHQDDGMTDKDTKTLQLHTLKSTFNNCVADQMQNIPNAKILPERPDMEQQAMDLQDAVQYVLFRVNRFEKIHRRRAEDFYCTGTAVTQICWDPDMNLGKGDIGILRWPIEAFLWDPTAEDLQDSRAVIKVSWHPLSWYRSHYPDAGKYVAGDNNMYSNVGVPDTQMDLSGTDEDRAALFEFWYRDYDARKKRYTINVAYVAGHALLGHDRDVYVHGMYPFVIDVHSTIEGQPVGDGLIKELINMQRYINKYAKYIDTNLRMSSKARMLARRGSGIDREALADWSQDIIEGERIIQGEDWAWLSHPPLNNTIVQQMLQMENELKNDSGMNTFSRGESSGGIVSGKAILALQEAGNKIANMRMVTLNEGFVEIVNQVIWIMAQFYTKDRTVLITGSTGIKRELNLNVRNFFGKDYAKIKDGVMPPPYTVQVEVDRRNPARVDAMNEMYMQAYTMAAQAQQYFPLSALFRIMNIDGKDRLLPIIEASESQQLQMQQMQSQMEQMAQQIEGLQQENSNLQAVSSQATNALANVSASRNGGFLSGGQMPGNTLDDAVSNARMNILSREASM